MTDRIVPIDQPARDLITTTGLDRNLFVEAGAGAGKTSSLVARIISLVRSGIAVDSIAAITFTEKAAAELRHRLRNDLIAAADQADPTGVEHQRLNHALDRLDHAPIGTLHAFARRILNEFPIESELPPGFTVLDELESNLAFDERWEDLLDELLGEADPAAGPISGGSVFVQLCKFRKFGIHKAFRRIANDFHDNWDLVADRVSLDPPPPFTLDLEPIYAAAEAVSSHDCPPGDKQEEYVAQIRALVEVLRSQRTLIGRLDRLDELCTLARKSIKGGNKTNWKRHCDEAALFALRDAHKALFERASDLIQRVTDYRKALIGAILGRWVLESSEARKRAGNLEFHDLLVLARRLLATQPATRRSLHERYQRVLLDEFQDTDPIQLAIAVRLTAAPDDPAHDHDWRLLRPLPGRLFIVGDPKQSIYRFRRADIAQYLRAADQLGAERALLSSNFRSSAAVIDWVNAVFGQVITLVPDAQPAYQELAVARRGSVDHGSVHLLGTDEHTDLDGAGAAEEVRRREAADVVAIVSDALTAGWLVGDEDADRNPILRPCQPGDIAILLPARTSLPALEQALRAVELPYRAENSSVVYVTTEIRHLMLALRAADDATDALALTAALRTPLYGCSDIDLYDWKLAGGAWSLWAPFPDGLDGHQVARSLEHLRSIARRATTAAPADLLAALVNERRVLDAALDHIDSRDVWRRIRYVVEQARAWSDAGGHGLRRYLAWVQLQATESRAADTILPEHDHDAVRIMTVHAAKGLEFPITIVSGLSTGTRSAGGYSVIWPGDSWALATAEDNIFDDYKPVDEQMSDAERRRLLYVACTRAVDHLVVSLHRKSRKLGAPDKMTSAELLGHFGAADTEPAKPFAGTPERYLPAPQALEPLPWPSDTEWAAERDRALTAASVRHVISATQLAAETLSGATAPPPDIDVGLDKEPVDIDLPPWQRGRYGTAIGRAVHAVLQFCDLESGADIAHHAAAQCAAEGILGVDQTVAKLAESARQAPIVQAALTMPHHRELFVAADVGGRVLEGYIDLFVQTPEGGVIVDYKTDQWPDEGEREQRIVRYRRQLAAYAVALEQITGEAAMRGVLVRCRPDGLAEEIEITGWVQALAEARAAIAAT